MFSCKPEKEDVLIPLLFDSGSSGGTTTQTTPTAPTPPVDNNDGTVFVSSQNLTWAKCSQDDAGANMYNSGANDCTGGSGTAGTFQYCNEIDNDCNGGDGSYILDGNPTDLATDGNGDGGTTPDLGVSTSWNTCDALVLGGRSDWRVPTREELAAFYYTVYVADFALFPVTVANSYWSSSTCVPLTAFAWNVSFVSGAVGVNDKSFSTYVRCVSTGP